MVARALTSLLLAIMTCHYVTHSVILRPKWFPYFRNREGQNRTEQMTAEEMRRHLEAQRQLERQTGSDAALQNRLDLLRAANCTALQSRPHESRTVAECFFRYSSLLMRMMQRGFASSP